MTDTGQAPAAAERGPNPIRAALSALRARRTRPPKTTISDDRTVDHSRFASVLKSLAEGGINAIDRSELVAYRDELAMVDPDTLHRSESIAFWLNLYNAGGLDQATEARESALSSVLRIPGRFERPWVTVTGETLSLDDIEHGKIRRFKDPRVHGALVCGSGSCPSLRRDPYTGSALDAQLDEQMQVFLRTGATRVGDAIHLSRVFLWFGSDFVRPRSMPTILPARGGAIARSLTPWLSSDLAAWVAATAPRVRYQPYDWGLSCDIS